MTRKKTTALIALILIALGAMSVSLSAQNQQSYRMDREACAHYLQLSREQVEKNNLSLAKVYAQKAIQANPWDKAAWAGYNDVIQRLADDGDIKDFDTFIEETQSADVPKASGASQFEGC
jgi:Tfp pilus assembly protein PilF